MASVVKLSNDKKPLRGIEFKGLDGKRCRLRLGRVTLGTAREFKHHIEKLLNARILGVPVEMETTCWLKKSIKRFGARWQATVCVVRRNVTQPFAS